MRKGKTYAVNGLRVYTPRGCFPPKYTVSSTLLSRAAKRVAAPEMRVLDLGTGTGYIAIELCKLGAVVTGVDVNIECLKAAIYNARVNGVYHIFDVVAASGARCFRRKCFDIAVANPPYLPLDPIDRVDIAICGGRDLRIVKEFIETACESSRGPVLMAISSMCLDKLRDALKATRVNAEIIGRKPAGLDYVIVCKLTPRR